MVAPKCIFKVYMKFCAQQNSVVFFVENLYLLLDFSRFYLPVSTTMCFLQIIYLQMLQAKLALMMLYILMLNALQG